jgi:hypothetical protein
LPAVHETVCFIVHELVMEYIRVFEKDLQEPSATALVATILSNIQQMLTNTSKSFLLLLYDSLPFIVTKLSSAIFTYEANT